MTYPIDTEGVPYDLVSRVSAAINEATKSGLDWDDAVSRVAADTQARARRDGRELADAIALGRFVQAVAHILETDLAAEMFGQMLGELFGCEIRIRHQSVEIDEHEARLIRILNDVKKVSPAVAFALAEPVRVAAMVGKGLIEVDDGAYRLTAVGEFVAQQI
jgi:hypothetical protein